MYTLVGGEVIVDVPFEKYTFIWGTSKWRPPPPKYTLNIYVDKYIFVWVFLKNPRNTIPQKQFCFSGHIWPSWAWAQSSVQWWSRWWSRSSFVVEIEAVVEVDSELGWQARVNDRQTESAAIEWMIIVVVSLCATLRASPCVFDSGCESTPVC